MVDVLHVRVQLGSRRPGASRSPRKAVPGWESNVHGERSDVVGGPDRRARPQPAACGEQDGRAWRRLRGRRRPDGYGPGIVAERDIVRAVAAGLDLDAEQVRNHMARDTVVATPTWPLEQAAEMMMRGRCRTSSSSRGVRSSASSRSATSSWPGSRSPLPCTPAGSPPPDPKSRNAERRRAPNRAPFVVQRGCRNERSSRPEAQCASRLPRRDDRGRGHARASRAAP